MAACQVANCTNPAKHVVDIRPGGDYPVLQRALCADHYNDFRIGGKMADDNGQLLMGDQLPYEIVGLQQHEDVHGTTVTLQLGRPPQVLQTVNFRVGKDFVIGDIDDPQVQSKLTSRGRE